MAENSVDTIIMSVGGDEYDVATFSSTKNTGRKPKPTMNRQQRVKFKTNGIRTFELSWSVVIPDGKDSVNWDELEDERISIESPSGGFRETYIDVSVTTVSDSYDVNGESRRDLTGFCLDYVKESI